MGYMRIGFFVWLILAAHGFHTGFAADESIELGGDVTVFRAGQQAPPHKLLGVVYAHRWSLPGSPPPDWQMLYDVVENTARQFGADMVVGAMTGEDDPLIEAGEVRWFVGLAALSAPEAADSLEECDNCVVDWCPPDSSALDTSDPRLVAAVERRAFAVSRLRLAEAGYYLRDWTAEGRTRSDTTETSNLRLEVRVKRGPTDQLASPENISFAVHLIWKVSGAEAWTRIVEATESTSRFESSGSTTRNALIDLYSGLPQRGPTPDSDGDGVPDSRDKEPGTLEGADVDFFGKSLDDDGDGVPNGIDRDPNTMRGVPVDQWGRPVDTDGDGVSDYLDECPDTPAGYAVNERGCPVEEWIEVMEDVLVDQGVLRERLLFDVGSATLQTASKARLDTIGVALSGLRNLHFSVEGHCDDQGGDDLNDMLSEMRAQAVIDYLVTKFRGLTRDQFTARGWGKRRPIAEETDELSRALNRRVEFLVVNPEEAKRVITKKRLVPRKAGPAEPPADNRPDRRD